MSVPVALDELARHIEEYGPNAFLVTTSLDGRPHVVSVLATFDGRELSVPAGNTSRANAERSAVATVLWPSAGPYCLIVDGVARAVGDTVRLDPSRAVLHRVAGAPADLPNCVRIEEPG